MSKQSSRIPVSSTIFSSNFLPGFTKLFHFPVIVLFSTLTAPISMILSRFASSPVVSKSMHTYVSVTLILQSGPLLVRAGKNPLSVYWQRNGSGLISQRVSRHIIKYHHRALFAGCCVRRRFLAPHRVSEYFRVGHLPHLSAVIAPVR